MKRNNISMPPLWNGGGHGAVHPGSLPGVGRTKESTKSHSAVRAFCEQVMLAKERAKREMVRTGHPAWTDREERRTRRGRPQVEVLNQE
jgi:hypothetical protein